MKSLVCALALASLGMAGDISNSVIGYTLSLPAQWGLSQSKPLQDYYRDSTRARKSLISIVRYSIDKASYPTPESWSQAQFIAYKLSVETSVYPFGAVMYFDTSAAAMLGTVWSPEAYSILYPGDGDPTYSEYIRYTAIGDYGYEIYAIGDSTDMAANIDFYAGIIATLKFSAPVDAAMNRAFARRRPGTAAEHWYDATGRSRRPETVTRGVNAPAFPWAGKPGG